MADAEDALKLDILKQTFVKEWLKTNDPFKAGIACFPADNGRALRCAWEWTQDVAVLAYRQELLEDSVVHPGLPTKEELALEVYQRASKAVFDADAFEGLELVGKIMGYIEKPSVNIDNRSVNVVNKVMVVKDHGTDEDWEKRLHQNQTHLTQTATKPN